MSGDVLRNSAATNRSQLSVFASIESNAGLLYGRSQIQRHPPTGTDLVSQVKNNMIL